MIKQFVESDYCLNKCRMCCRFSQQDSVWSPALLNEEIVEFEKRNIPPAVINKDKKIRLIPYQAEVDKNLPDHIGQLFICPFLSPADSKCKVYDFRPLECRIYPFLINRRKEKIFLSVDLGCPFVKERIETKAFKDYAKSLAEFLNAPAQISIIRNNPQLLQVYDDAFDISEIIMK